MVWNWQTTKSENVLIAENMARWRCFCQYCEFCLFLQRFKNSGTPQAYSVCVHNLLYQMSKGRYSLICMSWTLLANSQLKINFHNSLLSLQTQVLASVFAPIQAAKENLFFFSNEFTPTVPEQMLRLFSKKKPKAVNAQLLRTQWQQGVT